MFSSPHEQLCEPVIRDVNHKCLWQIAHDIADLAVRAQMRKVRLDEMGGASMTISNLDGIGDIGFTPIVNPPEIAIPDITRTETVPVWQDGNWIPVLMALLDLSYNYRVINSAAAARFVAYLTGLLADPSGMFV